MINFDFFSYESFAALLKDYIKTQADRGRGSVRELAEYLGISSPHVSQFLSGAKTPNLDQALQIAAFLKWTKIETEYVIALVEFERAGHHETKKYFSENMEKIRQRSRLLVNSVEGIKELSDEEKIRFYSHWGYSAVRLFCSLGEGKNRAEIAEFFPELRDRLDEILGFLLAADLVVQQQDLIMMGTRRTFVPKGSFYLPSHHKNWRLRAIDRAGNIGDEELMFTAPFSVSKKGLEVFRSELQDFIKSLSTRLDGFGDAEEVVCLNIDLFKIVK